MTATQAGIEKEMAVFGYIRSIQLSLNVVIPDDIVYLCLIFSPTIVSPQQQRIEMRTLGLRRLKLGELWYAIDKLWYDSWQRYTIWDVSDEDIAGGFANLHKRDIPIPGAIHNHNLQDRDNRYGLKQDIEENGTYVWIHQDQWLLLHSWYGGGPAFSRKVYERRAGYGRYNDEPYICVYPQFVKLVYCDDETGEIDDKKFELMGFASDSTLKQIAKEFENEMGWIDDDKQDNTPYVHIWLKFGQIKHIYPIDKTPKLTKEELECEDTNKWVEVPDDYLKIPLQDIIDHDQKSNDALINIVIERKQKDGIWPRVKGNDWRTTLQTGDIIDAKDDSGKWHEALVRYLYRKNSDKYGQCIIHYIGRNIKWNQELWINEQRLAKRNIHTKGPHRLRKRSNYGLDEHGKPEQHGVVGLRNLGNTSFMNTTIQCLAQSPLLTEYFLNNHFIHNINIHNPLGWQGRIAKAWNILLHDIFSDEYKIIRPIDFKSKLGEVAPRFMGYQQQDAWECLSFLLDAFDEDLNRVKVKSQTEIVESDGIRCDKEVALKAWKTFLKRSESVIVDLFTGQYKCKVVCPDCDRVSVTFDPYNMLSVPIPTQQDKYKELEMKEELFDLTACIEEFCKEIILDENESWYCLKCKDFKCASKKIDLWSTPDLLIVHLKRFVYTRNYRNKIRSLVKVPINGLDLSAYVLSESHRKDAIYDLYAISNHIGGMGGGHDIAYVKNLNDQQWYEFDDSRTAKMQNIFDKVSSSAAYILYYRRCNLRKQRHKASEIIID